MALTEQQITEVFQQELGREPSQEDINFYTQRGDEGLSFEEFSGQVNASTEGSTVDPTGSLGGTVDRNLLETQTVHEEDPTPAPSQEISSTGTTETTSTTSRGTAVTYNYDTSGAATEEQIRQVYSDVLGRDADQGGLDFYLNSGMTQAQIADLMDDSDEFQDIGGIDRTTPATESQIQAAYTEILGRDADAEGIQFYLDQGISLARLREVLADSPEGRGELNDTPYNQEVTDVFSGLGITAPSYVINHYTSLLESGEIASAQLEAMIRDGEWTRSYNVVGTNGEPIGEDGFLFYDMYGRVPTTQEADIIRAYREALGRMPDADGLKTYANTPYNELVGILSNSLEAIQGAGARATVPGVTPGQAEEQFSELRQTVQGQMTNPTIPESAQQTYTALSQDANQFMDPNDPAFIADPAAQATAVLATAAGQDIQNALNAATVDPTLIGEGAAGTAVAAQGSVDPLAIMEPAEGSISVMAEAAQGETPPEALVTYQLNNLLSGIEDGNIPAWAQPAVDAVESQLAARGISRSSVGRAQLTNAIITSAIPLAQQNAQTEAQTFWKNLDNRQQAAITNAQNLAQMDLANLNAAQQAQVTNAQAFLQMDLQNLSNEQQITVLDAQMRQQAYLSDQAASNAASQFNATSQNQADQFITSLNANIEQQNAARETAISQFNAQQANALEQFNIQLEAQREQFNTQNATAIEQSNVQWRRQMNQLDTAGINAINQANAMNAFNLSNQAMTFLWQEYRDKAKWEFDAGQNQANRETQLAMAAMGNEAATNSDKAAAIAQLGAAAFNFFRD